MPNEAIPSTKNKSHTSAQNSNTDFNIDTNNADNNNPDINTDNNNPDDLCSY